MYGTNTRCNARQHANTQGRAAACVVLRRSGVNVAVLSANICGSHWLIARSKHCKRKSRNCMTARAIVWRHANKTCYSMIFDKTMSSCCSRLNTSNLQEVKPDSIGKNKLLLFVSDNRTYTDSSYFAVFALNYMQSSSV